MAYLWRISVNFLSRYRNSKTKAQSARYLFKRDFQTETSSDIDTNDEDDKVLYDRGKLNIRCGKFAKLADGCAVVEYGGTAVMATVVGKGLPQFDEVPLTVHYQQKAAAIGRIPTNYLRREIGANDNEILTSRVIDRSLRPLFELGSAIETQIICNPLALDGTNFPDVIAINAASAALACSDIPWKGPVAATRVGLIGTRPVVNPTKSELAESSLNLIVTGMRNNLIVMMEGSCDNTNINDLQKCVKVALKVCKDVLQMILNLQKVHGKKKRLITPIEIPSEVMSSVESSIEPQIKEILTNYEHDKLSRDNAIQVVSSECLEKMKNDFPDVEQKMLKKAFYLALKKIYRSVVFDTNKRCDGRNLDDMRTITCETGLYEALHGSSVFQRGQTQVFCTIALDSPNSALKMDTVSRLTSGVKEKNFFVHYDFPPYSTGEIGIPIKHNRRSIGHGALAEKALNPSIPKFFPFTIRLTSEVFESNGSSSMATVCGGTLALLDAGIPLQFQVSGVAMGLLAVMDGDKVADYRILTDLMGMEDYLGDMDFKIAGTKVGITAIQLDMKLPGLPVVVIYRALQKAKKALTQIFIAMNKTIKEPRSEAKENWPVTQVIEVAPKDRSKFIGLGGSNIKKLELEVGIEVIEMEDGKFSIFAVNQAAMDEATERIKESMAASREPQLEFGGIYTATIVEIKENGCCVTLYPHMTPAFIHVSQLDMRRVNHPSVLGFEIGNQFLVKYFGRDPVTGAMRLSRKAILSKEEPSHKNM